MSLALLCLILAFSGRQRTVGEFEAHLLKLIPYTQIWVGVL